MQQQHDGFPELNDRCTARPAKHRREIIQKDKLVGDLFIFSKIQKFSHQIPGKAAV